MQEEFIYQRKITHTQYKHGDRKVKKGGLKGRLHTVITDNAIKLTNKRLESKKTFLYASDKFVEVVEPQKVTPIVMGGFFLLIIIIIIIGGFKFPNEITTVSFIIPSIIALFGFLFYVAYYFTMPLKENIFNREDGIITFSGFMWYENITMPIEKIIFTMSGPGSLQGGGAFRLLIERPDKLYTKYDCSIGGENCYQDLSFILWYMDKNRPLPPGEAFDPYRQQDFERRKAEGFPKPLYPSKISTPEATKEQQAERKRIGGW
ncbi:hypothetical protein [Tenacibaculum discolor]|uniref:hypothetical protein n=1 Tax=Tenacibaculum discolor TaxID=361581 RepID=UPI000EB365AC|nr:hypothetical protein [Tenacibaculum discolor]RLJ98625.1 hypothetical protein C8N27_2528 [Tenacibaculum discolor]